MFNLLKRLSLTQYAIALTAISVAIRFLSLGLYPLMDTTEARYGEMARIMYETGNWITPMFDYNIPFWGKPPLFTWLSAAGFEIFGVNEFAARIPHFIVGLFILCITWIIGKKQNSNGEEQAWLAVGILATTSAFIVISGAVMTDTALTFGIALSMTGFWLSWTKQSRFWGYMFFIGLSIGMLAKGPLTLILVGISLTLWIISERNWKRIPVCLPWKGGIVIFLALTLPWYLLAEWKSPGFLNYFIVGEHIKRFIVSGWQGDLYGTAHKEMRGTIWLYWALSALPWTPVFCYQVSRVLKNSDTSVATSDNKDVVSSNGYFCFLWCWMLSPLILFTFSGNILSSYVMPGLPAFALLVAGYQGKLKLPEKVYKVGLITPMLIMVAGFLLHFNLTAKEPEKNLLSQWFQQTEASSSQLMYLNKRPFSAQFYSNGKAKKVQGTLPELLHDLTAPAFVVLSKEQAIKEAIQDNKYCELRAESTTRQLLYCNSIATGSKK